MPEHDISTYMLEALAEAKLAAGRTSPNPPVGAVVVVGGTIIARGHTQPPGGAHAEVMALREAGDRARGATLYCTLEPCAHQGRTPACTGAILESGVAEVVYAIGDPDPLVDGRGDSALREAGVRVTSGDGADAATRLLEGYITHRRTGRPQVVVKYAASLDGRIAASSGDSRWVSGAETLEWAHEERQRLDAIVVGSGTVVIDNPSLTARPGGSTVGAHQPLRVVADSRGRTPATAAVLQGDSSTLIATSERSEAGWRDEMAAAGAEVLVLPERTGADDRGHIDLEALIDELGRRGMLIALFEGGGVLLGSLFDLRLVDRLYAVIAPVVIGSDAAPAAIAGQGVAYMAQAPRLRDVEVRRLGEDTLITGVPEWPSDA